MQPSSIAGQPQRLVLVSIAVTGALLFVRSSLAIDPPAATPAPAVYVIHPSYAYDFRDQRVLAGFADALFLGEVVKQTGSKGLPTSDPGAEIPQTQFSVKVIERITGDLPDEVVVSQGSAIDQATGDLLLLDGDPLLVPGEVVLFAVNREPDLGWYAIVAGPYGALRTKDAADADRLVAVFTLAAANPYVPVPNAETHQAKKAGKRKTVRDHRP